MEQSLSGFDQNVPGRGYIKVPIIQHTYFGSMFSLEPAKNQRGVAKLVDNQRPPPRPKFDPNAPGRMPPPFLAK